MGLFGWSYPPGCSGPPEHDDTCQMCYFPPERCICPPCPECGECGDPDCYTPNKHRMKKTFAQMDRQWAVDDANRAQWEAEDRLAAEMGEGW